MVIPYKRATQALCDRAKQPNLHMRSESSFYDYLE
jgi:hypothetical protein